MKVPRVGNMDGDKVEMIRIEGTVTATNASSLMLNTKEVRQIELRHSHFPRCRQQTRRLQAGVDLWPHTEERISERINVVFLVSSKEAFGVENTWLRSVACASVGLLCLWPRNPSTVTRLSSWMRGSPSTIR